MAASSSGDPPVPVGAVELEAAVVAITVEATADSDVPVVAHALGQKGCIFLDQIGVDTYVCTNIVTHERRQLPPGQWEAIYDPSLDCYVFAGGEDGNEAIDVEEFMTQTPLKHPDSDEIYIASEGANGQQVKSLQELRSRFRTLDVELSIMPTNAQLKWSVFVFHRPRPLASRAFWSLISAYKALGLTTYTGQPTMWVYRCQMSWAKTFAQAFGEDQLIVSSTHLTNDCKREKTSIFDDRCLPATSVSTVGLLWLLYRWSALTPRQGGMTVGARKDAAEAVARSLISSCTDKSTGFDVQVRCSATSWKCPWPRPYDLASELDRLTFTVSVDGFVDLSPLRDAANGIGGYSVVSVWWGVISSGIGSTSIVKVPLHSLLMVLITSEFTQPMAAQFIHGCAAELERSMGLAASRDSPVGRIQCSWQDIGNENPSEHVVGKRLVQHVLAARRLSNGHHQFSMMTDKAWIGGLPLQVTVQTLTTGYAIVCGPAVSCVHIFLPPRMFGKASNQQIFYKNIGL